MYLAIAVAYLWSNSAVTAVRRILVTSVLFDSAQKIAYKYEWVKMYLTESKFISWIEF